MTKLGKTKIGKRRFLTQWAAPVVVAVSLPAHAKTSAEFLTRPFEYIATISNQFCDDTIDPPSSSFKFCNEENGSIVIEDALISLIGQPLGNGAVKVLSPTLPITIAAGDCVDFMIENSGTPPFNCGDSLTLVGEHTNENQEGFISFHL